MNRTLRPLLPFLLPALAVLLALASGACAVSSGTPAPAPSEREAIEAYYRGDPARSLEIYREILRREPADLSARANRARVLRETGRFEEALEELAELLVLEPADDAARLEAAETAILSANPGLGLQHLGLVAPSAESRYLTALALIDLGHRTEALEVLEELHGLQDFHPMAWYWSARLKFEHEEYEEAERRFHKALAQDANLTLAFPTLARTYLALGQEQKAFGFLQRAGSSLPGNAEIQAMLRDLEERRPALAEADSAARERKRETAMPRQAAAFPEGRESLPVIRIGLVEKARQVYLKTGGLFRLSTADGRPISGKTGQVLDVLWQEGELEVADAGGRALLRSAGEPVRLLYDDPAATTILFDVEFGQGTFWAGSDDRMYRGLIELAPGPAGLTVINELPIEEYLYAVLPSEMPSSWPAAALQAQAIAARTYTIANLGRFASRGFDLLGSVASAAYGGMLRETAPARAAIDETRGLILVNEGRPVPAFYSANCGGHTETTESVWGAPTTLPAAVDLLLPAREAPLPPQELARWLAARPASYSSHPAYSSRSAYRWVLWVPRREIESRLERGEALGSIRSIVPAARGVSGRAAEVRILGTAGEHTVKGDSIRWMLGGLRSNLFTVQPKLGADGLPEYFIFTGGGWGHGVGLCQSGAAGMAAAGHSAEEILRHYYGSAELERRY